VVVHLEGMTHGTDERSAIAGAHGKSAQYANEEKFHAKWADELRGHAPPPRTAVRGELFGSALTRRPRVLVCDWVIPAADKDSTSHRMDAMLRVLAPLTSRLTLVPRLRGVNYGYVERLRRAGVEVVVPPPRQFDRFLKSRRGLYDVVVLSRPAVAKAWLGAVRRHQPQAQVVFDTVDLHSVRFDRERVVTGASPTADPERTRELERRLVGAADLTVAITEDEARQVRQLDPSARVVVLPNVHELAPEDPPGFEGRSGLLFIGMFLHSPNTDAVAWFTAEVLPKIRERLDVKLVVIGEDPPPSLVRNGGSNVAFTGWVQDVKPLFDSARVFVAPLRFGAGMKGKIGHALSLGLPTVTTSVGAEGMDLRDGHDVLIRDDAEGFAEAVCVLHEDEQLWRKLSASGRDLVRQRWTPEAMSGRWKALLADLGQPRVEG
jgi:glycosyltransferase involved in cell wall biosynthesis